MLIRNFGTNYHNLSDIDCEWLRVASKKLNIWLLSFFMHIFVLLEFVNIYIIVILAWNELIKNLTNVKIFKLCFECLLRRKIELITKCKKSMISRRSFTKFDFKQIARSYFLLEIWKLSWKWNFHSLTGCLKSFYCENRILKIWVLLHLGIVRSNSPLNAIMLNVISRLL